MEQISPTAGPLRCPRCRSFRGFHAVSLQGNDGDGCLMFVLGGIIPYLIYSSRQSNLVECENCHLVFRPPAPPTQWKAVLILLLIAAFVALIAISWGLQTTDHGSP